MIGALLGPWCDTVVGSGAGSPLVGLLCAASAALLVGLLAVGFGLRPLPGRLGLGRPPRPHTLGQELGLLGVWRLYRQLPGRTATPQLTGGERA